MRSVRAIVIGLVALMTGVGIVTAAGWVMPDDEPAGPVPVAANLVPAPAEPAPVAAPVEREPVTRPQSPATQAPQRAGAPQRQVQPQPSVAAPKTRMPVDDDVASGREQRGMASRMCPQYGVSC